MNQKPHVVRAEPDAPVPARLRLIGLIVLMAVAGIGLWSIAGPPRLPASLPAPGEVLSVLSGSVLPLDGLATLLVDVTWLMWLWVVGSLALEVVVVAAEGAAQGAAWVRALRQTADRLTLPLARRAVTAAFAVHVLSRGVAVAAADTAADGRADAGRQRRAERGGRCARVGTQWRGFRWDVRRQGR